MTLSIGKGITIGKGISIKQELPDPYSGLIVYYDAGNSKSYNGSGSCFNISYTGPNVTGYEQYGIVDLAGLAGGTWNSGCINDGNCGCVYRQSKGVSSYWSLTTPQYIDSTWQQNYGATGFIPTLNSPTYTLLAVIRPQDFSQGAIVGGDQNVFAFVNSGGFNDGPSLVAANSYGNPSFVPAVIDTTTVFELNTWYCVAVTYDAETGTMKLYTNGVLVDTKNIGSINHSTGLYWGTLEGQLFFNGDLAVCMAYERALSYREILTVTNDHLSRYVEPAATNSLVVTNLGFGGTPWTVPVGVTSISVVAVGAGGGGTDSQYSTAGGDTSMIKITTAVVDIPTIVTGVGTTIVVDSALYPDILNVIADDDWIVIGNDITDGGYPAGDLVVSTYFSEGDNYTIELNNSISTTAGDQFYFYQAVVAAEGGHEISNYYYNEYNQDPEFGLPGGPGSRALPLITDGPYGQGGVVDWTDGYPIGGAGAGGYGIEGLAWNPQQSGTYYVDTTGALSPVGPTMTFSSNLLTIIATSDITLTPNSATLLGTQAINPGDRVMFTIRQDVYAPESDYTGIGVGTIQTNLQYYLGSDPSSFAFWDDGVYTSGSGSPTFQNNNDILDIAVARDTNLIWIRVNFGYWNGSQSADPSTDTEGIDISYLTGTIYPALSPWYANDIAGVYVITNYTFSAPSGFTLLNAAQGAGGTGGQGTAYWGLNATDGTGGAGGGGGGRFEDTGAGGGGTGLYGIGSNGSAGTFSSPPSYVALGGSGGSNPSTSGTGGEATQWNGGFGGFPGGGGGSSIGYWVSGNGGALAYRNNYPVTPGDTYIIATGIGGQGQGAGGSGANGAVRIVWPGDVRQFPNTNVGPDDSFSITITDSPPNISNSGPVTYTIYQGSLTETVLESGIIWGYPEFVTIADSVQICSSPSFPYTALRTQLRVNNNPAVWDPNCANAIQTGQTGSITQYINLQTYFAGDNIDIVAYAITASGTYYSEPISIEVSICLAEGTLITLADDSTKPIESITMSDNLKVWDFDNGVATVATPLWIKRKEVTTQYNLIKFSDGSELKTISQHRIFNKQAGKFTYPMTDETPIGTITVKSDGTEVTVISKKVVYELVNYYNIVTDGGYMNLYANSILTSLRWNNIYPITDMKYVKDSRTLRNRSEFNGIADRWIDGLRLQEHDTDIKRIRKYVQRLENTEAKEVKLSLKPNWSSNRS